MTTLAPSIASPLFETKEGQTAAVLATMAQAAKPGITGQSAGMPINLLAPGQATIVLQLLPSHGQIPNKALGPQAPSTPSRVFAASPEATSGDSNANTIPEQPVSADRRRLFNLLQLLNHFFCPSEATVATDCSTTVVVIGGAPGHHIAIASLLYPMINWYLLAADTSQFAIDSSPRIQIVTALPSLDQPVALLLTPFTEDVKLLPPAAIVAQELTLGRPEWASRRYLQGPPGQLLKYLWDDTRSPSLCLISTAQQMAQSTSHNIVRYLNQLDYHSTIIRSTTWPDPQKSKPTEAVASVPEPQISFDAACEYSLLADYCLKVGWIQSMVGGGASISGSIGASALPLQLGLAKLISSRLPSTASPVTRLASIANYDLAMRQYYRKIAHSFCTREGAECKVTDVATIVSINGEPLLAKILREVFSNAQVIMIQTSLQLHQETKQYVAPLPQLLKAKIELVNEEKPGHYLETRFASATKAAGAKGMLRGPINILSIWPAEDAAPKQDIINAVASWMGKTDVLTAQVKLDFNADEIKAPLSELRTFIGRDWLITRDRPHFRMLTIRHSDWGRTAPMLVSGRGTSAPRAGPAPRSAGRGRGRGRGQRQ